MARRIARALCLRLLNRFVSRQVRQGPPGEPVEFGNCAVQVERIMYGIPPAVQRARLFSTVLKIETSHVKRL
jgi:hypothetical protein